MNTLWENIAVAFSAIRMNVLRAILTIFIIAFGIMSLISMLTAVDGIKGSLYANFASVGSNTFTIKNQDELSQMRGGRRAKQSPPITFKQASGFKNRFNFPAITSISFTATGDAILQYNSIKTAPKIQVVGTDENYLGTSGLNINQGRNFTGQETRYGRKVALLGSSIKEDLFGPQDPVGQHISINGDNYMVIGFLQSKGSSFGQDQDQLAIIPIIAAQSKFAGQDQSYELSVQVTDINQLDNAINEATGFFRTLRQLKLNEDNNFFVSKSDSLAEILISNVSMLSVVAIVIGLITLLGAAVGLTNIMLVSVTERTREIGIRKAIGATHGNIRNQFLWESLVISVIGGVLGIIAGIIFGNMIAKYFEGAFVIPWNWIIFGGILCLIVGIVAGLYPALKAARLDPVESLRHE